MALHRTRSALRWLARAMRQVGQVLLLAWGVLAIWFLPLPSAGLRLALAIALAAFGIWAFWLVRSRAALLSFAGVFAALLLAWSAIQPRQYRDWQPEVAVLATAQISGDQVRITGVRDFDYRSVSEFTPRYVERHVRLSDLVGVDFYISHWMPGPVAHTFVSFLFDGQEPISISIEARPESHEGFSPIGSLFKQFELVYVVGQERDIVGVRTNHRGEIVHLYQVRTDVENARRLFLIYLERINELARRPEFYHLLSNNCTLNIVRYANAVGAPARFDIRHYLNGLFDSYLYQRGLLDTSIPFEVLRSISRVNESALEAGDGEDFSQRIRAGQRPVAVAGER